MLPPQSCLLHGGRKGFSVESNFVVECLKESSNCKLGMRETVKCRPTVAYEVQVDGNNIFDWTDSKILLKRDIDPMLL